jgi:hypothetical protein
MSRRDGKTLEIQVKNLFEKLLTACGYVVLKNRPQKSGTQDGFDIEIIIVDEYYNRHKIYIECKDYTSKLHFSEAFVKIPSITSSYPPDVIIFVSPHKSFGNPYNDTRLEKFYQQLKVPVEFLTPDNNVSKIIAFDEQLYEDIYGSPVPFEVNKDEIINFFKSFIFSTKPLRKIVINESDRQKYILNCVHNENYISRTISTPEDLNKEKETGQYWRLHRDRSSLVTLIDVAKLLFHNEEENNGIVVLGNPGTGKSIELIETSIFFWENYETEGIVPFYRPVNSFINSSEITDYLPKNWKNIPRLLILLDGLDEISYKLEFKAKLDKFLIDNQNSNVRFILSCRTSIYDSDIKNLGNFKCYELNDILTSQAINYLHKKYYLPAKLLYSLSLNPDQRDFFENPYYLNLFGQFYQENQVLPTNATVLTGRYIDRRLEDDRIEKYKNIPYDKSKITLSCKKVALTTVALGNSKIEDTKLTLLLKNDKSFFTNSCFVEKVYDEDSWKFEHKNIQEYFVADTLKNLDFKSIIEFIQIDQGTKKSHPSWLNSISHLLNLIEFNSESFNRLIQWFIDNDPEVLFKADRDRISEKTRALVFQNYFDTKCKKQTLWIGKYDSDFKELVKFAECNSNIEYLLKELADSNNHRRTRISAIELLSEMDLSLKEHEIREQIKSLISAPLEDVNPSFKSTVIDVIPKIHFLQKDVSFIQEIILLLGDLDHLEVTNSVLKLILEVDCNLFFDYIKDVTPKVLNNSLRKYQREGNLVTREKNVLIDIFKKLTSFEACLFEINIRSEHPYDSEFKSEENDFNIIVEKLVALYLEDKTIYHKFCNYIEGKLRLDREHEEKLAHFFIKTKTNSQAFYKIYSSSIPFDRKRYFLSYLFTEDHIEFLINEYENKRLTDKNIFHFRNYLSHYNYSLSLELQEAFLINTDYDFENNILKEEIRNAWTEFHKNRPQDEFDLLFNKEELKNITTNYFKRFKKEKFTRDDQLDDRHEYYNSLELQQSFPAPFISLIHKTFIEFDTKSITKDQIFKIIDSELYLMENIQRRIHEDKNGNLKISESQLSIIKQWCFDNFSVVDFWVAADYKNEQNHLKCYLIYFFVEKFDIQLKEEQYLDFLTFVKDLYLYPNPIEVKPFDFVEKKTGVQRMKERVISNIKKGITHEDVFQEHAIFSIKNNFSIVNSEIKEFISNSRQAHTNTKIKVLEEYSEKYNDLNFIKSLTFFDFSKEYSNYLAWTSASILILKNENTFLIKLLLEGLNETQNKDQELQIIRYLVRCNYEEAFKLLKNWIVKNIKLYEDIHYRISSSDWVGHTNPKSIPYLIEIADIASNQAYIFDTFSNPIRIVDTVLGSISKNNNADVCLQIIKSVTECLNSIRKDQDSFYLNTILNDTWKAYYSHKSKPFSFSEIAKKIEKYKYLIV